MVLFCILTAERRQFVVSKRTVFNPVAHPLFVDTSTARARVLMTPTRYSTTCVGLAAKNYCRITCNCHTQLVDTCNVAPVNHKRVTRTNTQHARDIQLQKSTYCILVNLKTDFSLDTVKTLAVSEPVSGTRMLSNTSVHNNRHCMCSVTCFAVVFACCLYRAYFGDWCFH